ncbi:hypothetical protein AK812_SmicGene21980 [Symbiodinium microadriaticum]|uniref:Uncharacterized protein n=1 Tax=Symbiodinium microadriaticum TaxID=2951 RepID=A0A1Q9DL18_SYMMI|nr:hypothetical protein AK812_SmicGene21980 [Symbiodinium microadriaticum]
MLSSAETIRETLQLSFVQIRLGALQKSTLCYAAVNLQSLRSIAGKFQKLSHDEALKARLLDFLHRAGFDNPKSRAGFLNLPSTRISARTAAGSTSM